ncbi:uncharacterized protein N7477_004537 [Penicillium maclennaniae]|uniref:uncharacterized protein n=1 Tax=Penicillium maclennaniae TaxID=1343394 RepID=UPI0025404C09|nr:uncharacterized protein N7477_004537 [Penicillium maclennaniae]KAJ5674603.1 hypothetical protein N7477_004537 [Penicillium maclennaniae]
MFPTRALLGRSVWKVFLSRAPFPRRQTPPPIRTQKRAATILPNFVGLRFAVHNGKTYVEVQITEEMVGRKLGEYVAYVFTSLPGVTVVVLKMMLICCLRTRKRFTYKQSKNK